MNNSTPTSNTNTNTNTNKNNPAKPNVLSGAAIVNILYTINYLYTSGTILMTITIGAKTVSSSFTFPFLPNSISVSGTSVDLVSINYDQNTQLLNFWYGTTLTSDCIYIVNPASCTNFSLSDSQAGSIYDMSNVTVTENVVTFGSNNKTNIFTLNFPTNFV